MVAMKASSAPHPTKRLNSKSPAAAAPAATHIASRQCIPPVATAGSANSKIPLGFSHTAAIGNVVEAVTVQAADLHVLNRRSLHRHVRRLLPGNRHQTRCGPEDRLFTIFISTSIVLSCV